MKKEEVKDKNLIYIAADPGSIRQDSIIKDGGGVARIEAGKIADELREKGYSVDLDNNSQTIDEQFRVSVIKNAKILITLKKDMLEEGIVLFWSAGAKKQKVIAKEHLLEEIEKVMLELNKNGEGK